MNTVTDKEIQEWKAQYGEIFSAEFDDDNEENPGKVIGFFKKPDRQTLNYISTLSNQPFKMMEQTVNKCWLGGDTIILKDERYLMGAAQVVNQVIEIKEGQLKKY